jgi:hypothetical protein
MLFAPAGQHGGAEIKTGKGTKEAKRLLLQNFLYLFLQFTTNISSLPHLYLYLYLFSSLSFLYLYL